LAVANHGKEFLASGGEMGALMRDHDWSTSPLDSPEYWPQSLRSALSLILPNKHVMFIAWGPELAFLYNDAYRPVLGQRHPWALGQPFKEVWPEIWGDVEPLVNAALGGEATWSENLLLVLERNGYPEDCWFTFSYSPLRDDDGVVAGLFCAGTETTGTVLTERRLKAQTESQRRLFEKAPGFIAVLTGPDHVLEFVNDAYVQLAGRRAVLGLTVREVFPELEIQGPYELLDRVYATGKRFVGEGRALTLRDAPDQPSRNVVLNFIYEPIRDVAGNVTGIFVVGHDVTESYLTQKALQESEGRFRALVNATANIVFRMGPDGREMRHLDGAGLVVDTNAPTTDWTETYIPADEQPRVRQAIERAVAAKSVLELEHRVLRADGTIGWTFSRAIPLVNDAGEITEWFGTASDVTARVKADRSFTRLFEASPAAFLVLAPNAPHFTITDVNNAYLATTVRTRAELVGRGVFDAFPDNPDDEVVGGVNPVRTSLERVVATRLPDHLQNLRYDVARPDGTYEARWWSPFNTPILDENGDVEAIIQSANEVTEEYRAQAALRASEARLKDLNVTLERRVAEALAEQRVLAEVIEGSDILVQVADCSFNWLAINRAAADEFARIFGVRLPEAGDNMLAMLEHRPHDRAAVEAVWSRALGGEEFVEIDAFGDPAIDRPHYEMRFRVLRGADGGVVGAYQFVSDVSERLREQSRLRATEEALRQSQKMEAMGLLTGGVAHDFNNLLTPILYGLDTLGRRQVSSERDRRLIDGALQSAERATILVQSLLAFSRRQPLQPVAVDISNLVAGMAGLLETTLGPTIKLHADIGPGLPPANADPNQLEMALLNLAVNARDAMPDGGTFSITAKRQSARQGNALGLATGHYVLLCIVDTGAGMDDATRERAVEPFFSTKGIGKGTGLGLSMVHGLAAQLGGGLTIDSAPGKGTTIELWLPISTAEICAGQAPAAVAPPCADRGVALLVDDEVLVRMSIAGMLTDLGFPVVEAGSAEEALQLLAAGTAPNILVTDHLMHGMTGTDLAREARAIFPAMPILIVSGYAKLEGMALDLPLLTKPFRNADLAASIAALLPFVGEQPGDAGQQTGGVSR
jgi:signal transduction histidine kinase